MQPVGQQTIVEESPSSAFFEGLREHAHQPALTSLSGTLRFELTDASGASMRWLVSIRNGDVAVSRRNAKADCVLRAERALFDEVATGRVNLFAALLRGAVDVEGEVGLLVRFQRLFPGPQGAQ